jgi:hypothetical protein
MSDDTDFDFSEYFYDDGSFSAAAGEVRFEFVDAPALSGDAIEFTFRNAGTQTAPGGSTVAQIVVMSHDHNILGGGKATIRNDLHPGEVAGNRFRPLQYTSQDGEYYMTVTVGGDVRNVAYRVQGGRIESR